MVSYSLVGAGLSILQILLGSYMSLTGILHPMLEVHAAIAVIIIIVAILGFRASRSAVIRRMNLGNIGLVLLNTAVALVILFIQFNYILVLIHLLIGLGVLSNFSVAYGMERAARS